MPRRLLAPAACALILGGLAVVIVRRSDRLERSQPLKGLRPGTVARVELSRQGAPSVVLERRAGSWRLRGAIDDLAAARPCDELLQSLSEMMIGTEVSKDPASYASYDLTEASATRVRVFTQNSAAPALDAYFGKAALGDDSLYFRKSREKPVYIEQGVGAGLLGRPADDYRERALFPEDMLPIRSVRLAAGGRTADLKKDGPEWITAVNLRAADFLAEKLADAATGLDTPALVIEAAGPSQHARWLIGKARPEKNGKPVYRYARSEARTSVALVSVRDADALLKLCNSVRN